VRGTPKPILKRPHEELMCTIAAPDMRGLAAGAPEPASNTPDQSRAMMANALQRWACVVKDAGVRQE
jgi:hypothetical protein